MPTWNDELRDQLRRRLLVGQSFSLDEVYTLEGYFQQMYPQNHGGGLLWGEAGL